MSKRVADLLVETLQAAGVKTRYGIVGDTLNRIARAIDGSEIHWVRVRHEEADAFAAGAEALLTRPFSTRAERSRSMRQPAAKARTTRWSPRRDRGDLPSSYVGRSPGRRKNPRWTRPVSVNAAIRT